MPSGNTTGLRQVFLEEIDALKEYPVARGEFATDELLQEMARLTDSCGREIAVYLARNGEILDVFVGTGEEVSLPAMRLRRGTQGLSGIRCIHTHPEGSSMLSSKDENTLRDLRLDAMSAVAVRQGRAASVSIGLLQPDDSVRILGPVIPQRIARSMWMQEVEQADAEMRRTRDNAVEDEADNALLIGLELPGDRNAARSLDELEQLADTAGARTVGKMLQKRNAPNSAFYVGSGKLEEIRETCRELRADMVIFDNELTAVQIRNLEESLQIRIIDRTALILDIFAQRAASREGKLQVELAQHAYRLPRLTGMGIMLSRLGGGIGTRGPGEKKLEVNRRHIRRRMNELEQELETIRKQRTVRRSMREKNEIPVVALVGYTNAGKSTLLNKLSGSSVLAEDKLFATLDAVARRVEIPERPQILVVDTVGFIEKLPTDLVKAFRATLEEVVYADLLVHVIDASNPDWRDQRDVVLKVLDEIGAGDKPVIQAFNQTDLLSSDETVYLGREGVAISAKTGEGLNLLLEEICKALGDTAVEKKMLLPYANGAQLSRLHDMARKIEQEYGALGVSVTVTLDAKDWEKIAKEYDPFLTEEEKEEEE
ncbi:MAG: GTPase HflX [Clostridia bacterium]|nr:GTPase HflX [Clostridia bacterium]